MGRSLKQRLFGSVVVAALAAGLVLIGATAAGAATEPDNCTAVPDSGRVFDFTEACAAHDECYLDQPDGTGWSGRRQCDVDFHQGMADSCRADWPRRSQWVQRGACYGVAGVYYLGVRALGGLAWEEGQPAPLAEPA